MSRRHPRNKSLPILTALACAAVVAFPTTDAVAKTPVNADKVERQCEGSLPRIMILLDASSSMLNVDGKSGKRGETGWDQARAVLSAPFTSVFDTEIDGEGSRTIEDLVHVGVTVFGNESIPKSQRRLMSYGPCMTDNIDWALNPETSFVQQHTYDTPWDGPPQIWDFKNSEDVADASFKQATVSHMPLCEGEGNDKCGGSGTNLHVGLTEIDAVRQEYIVDPNGFPLSDDATFINILITDGKYSKDNSIAVVESIQLSLKTMFVANVTTHVIGMGDDVDDEQLEQLAGWGSGDANPALYAENQDALKATLVEIVKGLTLNPQCAYVDCSENAEPDIPESEPEITVVIPTVEQPTVALVDTTTEESVVVEISVEKTATTDLPSTSTSASEVESESSTTKWNDPRGDEKTGCESTCSVGTIGNGLANGLFGLLAVGGIVGRRRRFTQ